MIHKKKVCFVTGATGLVGVNLVLEIVNQKAFSRIVCIYRNKKKDTFNVLNSLDAVELVKADITDLDSLLAVCPEKCSCVFHVAGSLNLWKHGNEDQDRVNIFGCKNIVDLCVEKNVERTIYVSSECVYSLPSKWDRSKVRDLNEDSKKCGEFGFNYERSKYFGYCEMMKGVKKHGLHVVFLHPCSVLGEYDEDGVVRFLDDIHHDRLLGVPPAQFSWADVKEVAKVIIQASRVDTTPGEEFVIGGTFASVLELCQVISKIMGKTEPTKTISITAMHFISFFATLWSDLKGCWRGNYKKPVLTSEIVNRMTQRMRTKAERVLGYEITPLNELCERLIKFRMKRKWNTNKNE